MILSRQSIEEIQFSRPLPLIVPFSYRDVFEGMSYGLTGCGYDIRINQSVLLWPKVFPGSFRLSVSRERLCMPGDLAATLEQKSAWVRKGLHVLSIGIEPGWCGFLTLEIANQTHRFVRIKRGSPIARLVFHKVDLHSDDPYNGMYQHQGPRPQPVLIEMD